MLRFFDFSKEKDIKIFKSLNFFAQKILVNSIYNVSPCMTLCLIDNPKTLELLYEKRDLFSKKNQNENNMGVNLYLSSTYKVLPSVKDKRKLKWLLDREIYDISIFSISELKDISLKSFMIDELEEKIKKDINGTLHFVIKADDLDAFNLLLEKNLFDFNTLVSGLSVMGHLESNNLISYAFKQDAYHICNFLLNNGFHFDIHASDIMESLENKKQDLKDYDEQKKLYQELKETKISSSEREFVSKISKQAGYSIRIAALEKKIPMITLFEKNIEDQRKSLRSSCSVVNQEKPLKQRL